MVERLPEALSETLEYLLNFWREDVRPEQAMACFRLLQERHREMEMDLVWEEETYSQAVHYDALLRLPGQGTVSLGFCPDRAVPWPLRRAHHSREKDLVRVNSQTLTVERAMTHLDIMGNEARITTSLVNLCLVQEAIEKRAIELSNAELQQAMDAFRKRHGLYSAQDTYRWLEQHGITHERLEQEIAAQALPAKLRDQVAEGRVEAHFDRHRSDFDTAHLARFRVAEEARAQRLYEQIRGGAVEFFEAAQREFLAGENGAGGDLFVAVQRRQISAEQAAVIFAASPGEVVGPLRSGEGYDIVRVLRIDRAHLDEPTRAAVKEVLFGDWLAERQQEATIEWFWGCAPSGT
jgi:putative peptide maturation system protein